MFWEFCLNGSQITNHLIQCLYDWQKFINKGSNSVLLFLYLLVIGCIHCSKPWPNRNHPSPKLVLGGLGDFGLTVGWFDLSWNRYQFGFEWSVCFWLNPPQKKTQTDFPIGVILMSLFLGTFTAPLGISKHRPPHTYIFYQILKPNTLPFDT